MVEPTPTEIARQQSLPSRFRKLPPEEVEARQTLFAGQSIPGRGGRVISTREIQKQQEAKRFQEQRQRAETSLRQNLTRRLFGARNNLISLARDTFRKSTRNFKNRNERLQAELELKNQVSIIQNQTTLAENELAKSSFEKLKERGQKFLSNVNIREKGIRERSKEREQRILQTPKRDLSKFERIERFLLEGRGKSELPFGLQDVVELKPDVVLGKKATPFTPLNFFARKISESKSGKLLIKQLEKESPIFRDILTLVEKTGTARQVVEILTLVQLGVLFDPAIRSGSSQEQQIIKKKLSQNRFNELNLDDVINDLNFKQEGKLTRTKTFSEKVADAEFMLEKIRNTKNKPLRDQQIKDFKKLMKSAHGKENSNKILNELLSQEVSTGIKLEAGEITKVGDIKGSGVPITRFKEQPPFKPEAFREVVKSSPLNQERVSQELAKNQERIQLARLSLGERVKLNEKLRTNQRTGQRTVAVLRTNQQNRFAQRNNQAFRQQELLRQRAISRLKTSLLLSPNSAQATNQKNRLKKLLRLKFKARLRFPLFIKRKPTGKTIKKIPFEITGNSFDVQTRKAGKFKTIFERLPKNMALKKGARNVRNTLRASFRLKPNPNPPIIRKDIKTFKPSSKVFRNKGNIFIERKRFRLDTKSEVRDIQKAKRLKKPFSKRL